MEEVTAEGEEAEGGAAGKAVVRVEAERAVATVGGGGDGGGDGGGGDVEVGGALATRGEGGGDGGGEPAAIVPRWRLGGGWRRR